jgi:hypothetical protein
MILQALLRVSAAGGADLQAALGAQNMRGAPEESLALALALRELTAPVGAKVIGFHAVASPGRDSFSKGMPFMPGNVKKAIFIGKAQSFTCSNKSSCMAMITSIRD